jgi:tRNA-uridine 2-sulfurtransferase
MRKKTVFVGLSGGVDSAVSAALLQKQGYEVVGVFIKTWHPEFLECNEEEERRDAMRVAAHLDIPFLTFDLEKVYKKEVADYMIREYKAGRTPNPDVMCNKEVKFGAFLKKALTLGADCVATGHYAQNINNKLVKGEDESKDQSYFLWALNRTQLSKIIFPVGHLKKSEVRKLANKFKLPVSEKKDSQGICFLGDVDLKKFLKHYIKEKKGKMVDEEGKVIGHHDGAVFLTLGERHGFVVTVKTPEDSPYYVVDKNVKKNTITVSHHKIPYSLIRANSRIEKINWINQKPDPNKTYNAQVRYHGELLACKVVGNKVVFEKPVVIASGQSVVIYDKDVCLGGGVVVYGVPYINGVRTSSK